MSMTTTDKILSAMFRAHPQYHGKPWYSWGYVQFAVFGTNGEELSQEYPSLILGYIQFPQTMDTDGNQLDSQFATIRMSITPVPWENVMANFVEPFNLSHNLSKNHVLASISSIIHPLCVINDHGGDPGKCFLVLPKKNWAEYFSKEIKY